MPTHAVSIMTRHPGDGSRNDDAVDEARANPAVPAGQRRNPYLPLSRHMGWSSSHQHAAAAHDCLPGHQLGPLTFDQPEH